MLVLKFKLEILEKPQAARALLVLYRYGPMNRGVLYDMLAKGPTTPVARVKELMSAGLVIERIDPDRKRHLSLTEKGLHVAMALDQVENSL